MTLRIFIKFRINHVSKSSAEKDLLIVIAIYLKLLDRDFDFKKDFIHAQEEILQDKIRYHVLINYDYHDSQPNLRDTILRFYYVIANQSTLSVLYIH